jgi:hypothetical protein
VGVSYIKPTVFRTRSTLDPTKHNAFSGCLYLYEKATFTSESSIAELQFPYFIISN